VLALSVIQSQLLRAVAVVITGDIMPALRALLVGVNCRQPGHDRQWEDDAPPVQARLVVGCDGMNAAELWLLNASPLTV
jgi:hypothetical protein